MSDVQIAIDNKSCVDHKVSPAAFEQKLKDLITGLGFTIEIKSHPTDSNILGVHPLGCAELSFSPASNIQKHAIYEDIVSIFNNLKQ